MDIQTLQLKRKSLETERTKLARRAELSPLPQYLLTRLPFSLQHALNFLSAIAEERYELSDVAWSGSNWLLKKQTSVTFDDQVSIEVHYIANTVG